MRARQALNPGRIKLTFEDGSTKYAVMERADNPVVEGDPLNPYTLLKDETCTMLGGDPETMVPDDAFQMLAALAASGGGSGDVGELEDTASVVGTFTNSGAGWNTFKFRQPFEGVPNVVCQAEAFDGIVQVQNVTKDGFQYCLRTQASGTYYVGASTGTTPSHSAATLVTGTTTTATAVKINYIAVEFGGER
jgi:hypothetical protein